MLCGVLETVCPSIMVLIICRYGVANCRPQDVARIKNGCNQGDWDLGISKTCSLADVHTQLIYCCDLIKP
jgi:hypothetical protein